MAKERLVVIGNGMVGARFVEELIARGGGDAFDIVVFGDEPYGNYNRILLSSVLSGTHAPADIFLNPLAWYTDNGVRLHAGARVERVDRAAKSVHAANGIEEPYDRLVFATGSAPFIPPLAGLRTEGGDFKEGVFVFRSLDDCDAILKRAAKAKRAAVIGGGLLGLEAARGLMARGVDVDVIHLMGHLMELQLDLLAGKILQRTLEGMGLRVHLGTRTTAVRGEASVSGLVFEDGSSLDCDLVVISAGIRPNVELARAAALTVQRGIVVGDDLASPDDDRVFAIGECAEHRGQTYGLVAPLWEQATILAERMTGRRADATYRGSKVSTKLKVMEIDLAVMGDREPTQPDDEVVTYSEPSRGIYKKLIVRGGRIVGAMLLGDASAAPDLVQAFDRGTELPANRSQFLFRLAEDVGPMSVAEMPDDTQICNCNGVSKGRIVLAVRGGARSLKLVCEATRAGTGCGSCKKQVELVLEYAAGGEKVEDPSIHYYVPVIPLTKPELVAAIRERGLRSVSAVLRALAGGNEDAPSKIALASLLKTLWAKEYEDERDARFINDRVHANIQKDATFSVVPRIYGGVVTPQELRTIADVAERHHVRMVKITGGQRIDLLGVPKEELPAVWKELGMPSGHAYTKGFRTCKTCVGTDFCRYGVGDAIGLGIAIERRFQGIESPHKMKLATAGCPRNCSEATTKDIAAMAIEGGRWEIYVGGAAGSRVRKGDILCVVDTHEAAITTIGRFMQYYRENGKYLERTYDMVERIGIGEVRRILVDDGDGICARLDRDIQAAVDAYADPWKEATQPVHPTQFAPAMEAREQLIPLRRAAGDR